MKNADDCATPTRIVIQYKEDVNNEAIIPDKGNYFDISYEDIFFVVDTRRKKDSKLVSTQMIHYASIVKLSVEY